MNVSIKKFDVYMELKNKGIELEVRTTKNEHLGDLVVTRTGLIWCQGRTTRKCGVGKNWEEIIEYFNGD